MADHEHPVDPDRVAAARRELPSSEDAARVAELFRLLGDPVRARIMYALGPGRELCVGDIALALGVPESAASYALRLLRDAGVVRRRREGRMIYYRSSNERVAPLLELLREAGLADRRNV